MLTDEERARYRDEHLSAKWAQAIPPRFWPATLDTVEASVRDPLVRWSRLVDPPNLVLLGPIGTGKTHAAIAACRAAHWAGREVVFQPVDEMLDLLRPGGPAEAFYDLCDVDVLIIDDIGAEWPSGWTTQRWYAVINRRWLHEQPTVVTTNLESVQLEEALGPATFSRLVGGATAVRLTGNDRRRQPLTPVKGRPA